MNRKLNLSWLMELSELPWLLCPAVPADVRALLIAFGVIPCFRHTILLPSAGLLSRNLGLTHVRATKGMVLGLDWTSIPSVTCGYSSLLWTILSGLVYVQITSSAFANGSNFCVSDQRAAAQQDHLFQRCVWIKGEHFFAWNIHF